ncbi:MAG: 50S ribosomal protein L19 [Phycisphaerales bacterium]|nr:50S ribosomal protein L19 [Phycisphaerales bacterium]
MYLPMIDLVEKAYLRAQPLEFGIGDTVDVHVRIVEGDKERVQVFNGVVIARRGHGVSEMFTVRRIVANEGVERIFMVHSPRVVRVEVKRHGKVRRAKLYYLRDRVGKARRLREKRRISTRGTADGQVANKPAPAGADEPDAEAVAVAGHSG